MNQWFICDPMPVSVGAIVSANCVDNTNNMHYTPIDIYTSRNSTFGHQYYPAITEYLSW